VTNADVARLLYELAELMDLRGDVFKRNAYRRAARGVETLDGDVRELARDGRLDEIPGVGKSIASTIAEIVETGTSRKLEELRQGFPPGLAELMRVPDLGPRTAVQLHRELGVSDLEGLKRAAEEHRIRSLKGFGERSEENILRGVEMVERLGRRMLLGDALPVAEAIAAHVRAHGTELVSVAGSMRRMRETVGDVDILAGTDRPEEALAAFVAYPEVAEVVVRGPTKSTVRLADGTQVDLRVVPAASFGAALQYFTGSKDHNVRLRRLALQKGLKLNEYGLFDASGANLAAGRDEGEVYRQLALPVIPPELREDRGEIEAALAGRLPRLVTEADIRGDLHVHTSMSDGRASMREVAEAAVRRGYEYIGITDHSRSLHVAHGLSEDDLLASVEQARQLTRELGFPVLRGAEVDILEDGSLDYPDEVLEQLDYVIGSVHSRFKMSKDEMTERVVAAMADRHLSILGHPTGRLLGRREPYPIDMERVMDEAAARGVVLELNSFPDRLDLNDLHCRMAKEHGVLVSVDTDAHGVEQLDHMRLGVGTARRGWLGPEDVLNTRALDEVRRLLRR